MREQESVRNKSVAVYIILCLQRRGIFFKYFQQILNERSTVQLYYMQVQQTMKKQCVSVRGRQTSNVGKKKRDKREKVFL